MGDLVKGLFVRFQFRSLQQAPYTHPPSSVIKLRPNGCNNYQVNIVGTCSASWEGYKP